jgi:hypothetical protein
MLFVRHVYFFVCDFFVGSALFCVLARFSGFCIYYFGAGAMDLGDK